MYGWARQLIFLTISHDLIQSDFQKTIFSAFVE
jgi:hypothetical protein